MGENIIAVVRTLPVQLIEALRSFPAVLSPPPPPGDLQSEGCTRFVHQHQFIQLDG